MTMQRRIVPAEIRSVGEDEFEVTLSTEQIARDGHVLVARGCDSKSYERNPIVLWQHNSDEPVGRTEAIEIRSNHVVAKGRFARLGISPTADKIRGLVKDNIINAVSVGFEPDMDSAEPLDPKRPYGGQRFARWELLEWSFVSVPADTGAMVTARQNPKESTTMSDAGLPIVAANRRALARASLSLVLKRGLYEVASLAYQLEQLGYAHSCAEWEAALEGDGSEVPEMLGEALKALGEAFIAMAEEEATELLDNKGLIEDPAGDVEIDIADRTYIAGAKTERARAWRTALVMLRAGKTISKSNAALLEKTSKHHARAMEQHKNLATHHEEVGQHMETMGTLHDKAQDQHEKVADALAKANETADGDAKPHIERAMKAHGKLGEHLDAAQSEQSDMEDAHEDVGDAHRSMARCVERAERCVRSVLDGAVPGPDDSDSHEAQTSAGDEEIKNDRDYRRRQAELLAMMALAD